MNPPSGQIKQEGMEVDRARIPLEEKGGVTDSRKEGVKQPAIPRGALPKVGELWRGGRRGAELSDKRALRSG